MQASKQQGRPASSPRRAAHFGSQIHIGTDRMLVSAPLQQHAASGVIRPHFYATQYLNSRTRACHKQRCTAQHLGQAPAANTDAGSEACNCMQRGWAVRAAFSYCITVTSLLLLLVLLLLCCQVVQSSPPEGSKIFSYVQTDEFCERFEASRCITTSKWEGQNHLARKLATDARNRQKVCASCSCQPACTCS